MKDDDAATVVLVLGGLWLLSKYVTDVVPALERSGASAYDWLHNDAGHKSDLPGHQLTRAALRELVTRNGFPDPDLAVAIILAESGGVPGSVTRSSRENSIGLFQINLLAHPSYSEDDMRDPDKNARAALNISRGGTDWGPWSTWWADPNHRKGPGQGAYKRYLPKGRA